MPDDEPEIEDGMIPIICECGRQYVWHVQLEPLQLCPACRTTIDDTDDDG